MDPLRTLPRKPSVPWISRLASLLSLVILGALALGAPGAPAAAVTISVSTLVDEPSTTNGNCTLREALMAAEVNEVRDLCPAGQAFVTDVIEVPAGTLEWNGIYHLESGVGGPVVLRGPAVTPPAAQIEIDAVTKGRFLRLITGARMTLENIEIRHGDVSENPVYRMGGAVLAVGVSNVDFTLRNVRLDGNVAGFGGGLYFETTSACDPCSLTIERSVIATNLAAVDDEAGAPRGGGAFLQIHGDTAVRIVDTRFLVNRVSTSFGTNPAIGGGLYAGLEDTARMELSRVAFAGNSAAALSGGPPEAGGAWISASGLSSLDIVDATFEHNSLDEPTVADGIYRATALHLQSSSEATFFVDRMKLLDNDPGDIAVDLRVRHLSEMPSAMSNVLVAGGAGRGAQIGNVLGDLYVGHLTIADHAVEELRLERGSGELRLENSILYGADALVWSGLPTIDNTNLIDTDPFFKDPAAGDYRLSSSSPARDLGNSNYVTVGRYDLGHGQRAVDDTDAGAYEFGALFSDDFELGSADAWSASLP